MPASDSRLLYIALDQGQRLYWLHSGIIVGLTVSGLFLLLMTVVRHVLACPTRWSISNFFCSRNTLLLGVVLVFFRFVMLATVVSYPQLSGIREGLSALCKPDRSCSGWHYPSASAACWPCIR